MNENPRAVKVSPEGVVVLLLALPSAADDALVDRWVRVFAPHGQLAVALLDDSEVEGWAEVHRG